MLAVSACASSGPDASAAPTAVALPDTPVGTKAQWVLDTINSDEETTEAEIAENIAPSMLEQVPASQMVAVVGQMSDAKPWIATSVTEATGGLTVLLHSSSAELQMQISVDEQNLINGLLFQQPPADRTPAASWKELEKNVAALPADTSMTVTHVTGESDAAGVGERIVDIAGDETKPLGSVFKLYVLGAVADAVAAGTLSWDDNLIISDDTRSLPSGELQDLPSGTLVTVRDAATKMIEISDNTATDLLIDRVGREAVEAQLAVMGHHDPTLNTPFVKTREFFQIGWGAAFGDARAAWADSSVDERRAVLDSLPGGVLELSSFDLSTSAWQQSIDWFANPADLVAAHLALQQKAATPAGEPVRGILSANPGLQFDSEAFPYVAFKGGSAPGVLAGSWLLERADGERFVITMQSSSLDPADVTDTALVFGNVTDAAALLADE
ncbi:Beta-lactamase enzyme family protein [Agreia sp. VKM Ac-1783]|nr:Beta-lactamase enzyme family protein [Agreia sp. VKM Ac-1783]